MRLSLILFLAAALAPQMPTVSTYLEGQRGVSFEYPATWKAVPKVPWAMPFLSTRSDGKLPKITLVYVPQGSYRRTQLDGLAFTYVHKELSDPRSCEDFAKIRSDNPQATFERTINGTIFKVANGGDLSGGHTIKARSFSTYRNGQCYAFEQDFMTSTHHGRPLTEVEADALQNQLNMLMESVQIPRM